MSIVRMIDRASVPASDKAEMTDWLEIWLGGLKTGDYGHFRSIVVLLERDDGKIGIFSQSIALMDTARLIGLLTTAAHRRMDGDGSIEGLAS